MKRINVKVMVPDKMMRWRIEKTLLEFGGEIEEYREKPVPKDGVTAEHGFDALTEAAMNVAEGAWLLGKGIVKMIGWSFHVLIGTFKWLWKEGAGKVKQRKDKKTSIFKQVKE
jgi:hypothetical protein